MIIIVQFELPTTIYLYVPFPYCHHSFEYIFTVHMKKTFLASVFLLQNHPAILKYSFSFSHSSSIIWFYSFHFDFFVPLNVIRTQITDKLKPQIQQSKFSRVKHEKRWLFNLWLLFLRHFNKRAYLKNVSTRRCIFLCVLCNNVGI